MKIPFFEVYWNDFITRMLEALPSNALPGGCFGDFDTNTILADKNSAKGQCNEFPLPRYNNISVAGFGMMNVPCGAKTVNVQMCTVFDKCGTFGVSIGGGTISCFTAATGIGAILAPLAGKMSFLQLGFSPNRFWEAKITFLDPKEKKTVTKELRHHLYLGTEVNVLNTGMKIGDVDLDKILNFKVNGKAFIDYGSSSTLNEKNQKFDQQLKFQKLKG
jgi:hypothetical protein